MNAGEILEQARLAMGADGWVKAKGTLSPWPDDDTSAVIRLDARPAWRDGDGWFVLPDGWKWDGDSFWNKNVCVRHSPLSDFKHSFGIRVDDDMFRSYVKSEPLGWADTAPDAFRAAQKWIDENEAVEKARKVAKT